MLVNKSKQFVALLGLTFFITFSGNCSQTIPCDITITDIEKTREEVAQLSKETIVFLQELNNAIPEISKDFDKISLLNMDILKTFLSVYKNNIKFSELIGLYGLKKPAVSNQLTLVAVHICIECLLSAAVAKIENKAILFPLNKADDYNEKMQIAENLNTEIESYVEEISKQIDCIRTTLNKAIKDQYNLEIKDDAKNVEKSSASEKLLEIIGYNLFPQLLKIQNKASQKNFLAKIENLTAQYLGKENIVKTIETILNKPVIAKIKAATTQESCKELISKVIDTILPCCDAIKNITIKAKCILSIDFLNNPTAV